MAISTAARLTLADVVYVGQGRYRVRSATGTHEYLVNPNTGTCDCPDRVHRERVCKHLRLLTDCPAGHGPLLHDVRYVGGRGLMPTITCRDWDCRCGAVIEERVEVA